jgi:large subunit ribosomal protein L29
MKADKIRNMDLGEIEREAQEGQEQLFRLRFQMGMGQLEGLKKYRGLRKDRARLLTIASEKRAAGETALAAPAPKKAAMKAAAKTPKASKLTAKASTEKTAAKTAKGKK